MDLPAEFLKQMQDLLGDEYDAFLESYSGERSFGLRYNPLKITKEDFLKEMPFSLDRVPWSREGFFYPGTERPGKHVFHEAGAYYIQEPSAMLVTELLDPKPGEKILDLCAAPGGKSTQIAGRMQGQGILISNEIHPQRVKALSQNLERMGVANALVLNETPEKLADRFGGFFDRILVDAPCSGEGMFRKEEIAVEEWTPQAPGVCAARQKEILEYASSTLREGGVLVYSTCTFAKEEDEDVIKEFLQKHEDYHIEMKEIPSEWAAAGVSSGSFEGTYRMWPHKCRGEGHFAIRLRKGVEDPSYAAPCYGLYPGNAGNRKTLKNIREAFEDFCKETCTEEKYAYFKGLPEEAYECFGEYLYLLPGDCPDRKGLKVIRAGLCLGMMKKERFEPDQALAMYLSLKDVKRSLDLENDPALAKAYLRGETLPFENGEKGWGLCGISCLPLGWIKVTGGCAKNHYPKGLRKNL